jgi:hypothetical protein
MVTNPAQQLAVTPTPTPSAGLSGNLRLYDNGSSKDLHLVINMQISILG